MAAAWKSGTLVLLAFALSPTGSPAARAAEAASLRRPVDIGQGRSLNLVCVGKGPTVLFMNGLGGSILDWKAVQQATSGFARACVYDRAGLGYSDPAPHASTAADTVRDLHALIAKAGLKRPLTLVGHSAGGLFATLYAETYPKEVSGLVLVDPSLAHQFRDWTRSRPEQRQTTLTNLGKGVVTMRECADLARAGQLEPDAPSKCSGFSAKPAADASAEERAYLRRQATTPAYYQTFIAEEQGFMPFDSETDRDSIEEASAPKTFGAMPVVVLTSGLKSMNGGSPSAEEQAQWRAFWKGGHDALAARSTRGKSVDVPQAGHLIQKDAPETVVGAIRKVMK